MKIKVCHLTSVHGSKDIRIFTKMCRSLARCGFDVNLVVANAQSEIEDSVQISGVTVRSANRLYRMIFGARAVYKKALKVDADIYHIHDPELLPWAVKLHRKDKKVIYDSHEDVPQTILDKEWIKPAFFRKLLSRLFDIYEKRQARKLDGLISVLDSITHKFGHPNAVTIHNFPRMEYFDAEPYVFDDSLVNRFKLAYNGGLTEIRDIHIMVEAMDLLDERFILILMGQWESEVYRQKCIAKPGWSKVLEMGVIDLTLCMRILKASNIGLLLFKPISNHLNSLPNKSFEYMAAQIPAIMSNFPFWMQEFGDYAHFVNPENPNELASKIQSVEANYRMELERAERASAHILQTKSWNNEAKKLCGFYNNLISRN